MQRDALVQLTAIMGEGAYQNALVLDALAETLMLRKQPDAAIALLQRSLALTASKCPSTHPVYQERQALLDQARRAAVP